MNKGESTALLFRAAYNGNFDLAQKALDAGANIHARDDSNRTPLIVAASNGYFKIRDLLETAAKQQQGHAGRVAEERKDKGPRQPGG